MTRPALAAAYARNPFAFLLLTLCFHATLRSASISLRQLQLAPAVVPYHRSQQPVRQQALWLPPAGQGPGGLEHGPWQLVRDGGQVPPQVGELHTVCRLHASM